MRKTCSKCQVPKDLQDFSASKLGKDGLRANCKTCCKHYRAGWYAKNADKWRSSNFKKFNLTLEQYQQRLASQGELCAICRGQPNGIGALHVDHDHTCCPGNRSCGKCIRGLLCSNCNTGMGLLKDSKEVLLAAIQYLDGSP